MKILLIIGSAVLGIGLFVVSAQISSYYQSDITQLTNQVGAFGPLVYIGLTTGAIVVAPLGFGFLIPVATQAYGPLLAAVYSVVGWTLGSVIVWWLIRRYAKVYVQDTKVVQYIQRIETSLPPARLYVVVLLLRVALPVDVLSYALGLGSSIRFWPYLLTTVVGITPFAVATTYAAAGTMENQLVVGVLAAVIFLGGTLYITKYSTRT